MPAAGDYRLGGDVEFTPDDPRITPEACRGYMKAVKISVKDRGRREEVEYFFHDFIGDLVQRRN